MSRLRIALLAALIAVFVPAAHASATSEAHAQVRGIATDAAALLTEENALIAVTDPATTDSPTALANAQRRLTAVDNLGFEALRRLELLNVDTTIAIDTTLALLPSGAQTTGRQFIPAPVVYQTAIDDLLRIAATPEVVSSMSPTRGSQSFGLLAVAAAALLLLGAIALTTTLRHGNDHADLAEMAWSDSLTGLANRRRLDHDMIALHQSEHPADRPTAIIMIDIDHFKNVNDRFGHQVGDEVLRAVSEMLSTKVRIDDIVYRYGGEEFVVLLRGANNTAAHRVAERIVAAARDLNLPEDARITISAGVADGEPSEITGTLESADRALYQAKRDGRDRAVEQPRRSEVSA